MAGEIVNFPHSRTEEGVNDRENDRVINELYVSIKQAANRALEYGMSQQEVEQWIQSALYAFHEENKKG